MRSTCSGVASPSCTSRSASSPNGRPQRLTRKPGPSPASITWRPIARPSARVVSSAASPDCSPATTSTSSITGAGLKKCMPTTRSGPGTPAAISVTLSDEVLVASTQSSPHDLGDAREQRAFELERLRRRLDDDVGFGEPRQFGHALERPARARLQPPLLDLVLEPLGDAGQPALQRLGISVVDERARARRRGELRDAGAHRAGAEDPDDHYDGTSALRPVSARPMISFWICEVPS